MVRVFRHYISMVKLWLIIADLLLVTFIFSSAISFRQEQIDLVSLGLEGWGSAILVSLLSVVFMLGMGCYTNECLRDVRVLIVRLLLALGGVGIFLSAILYFFREIEIWRSTLVTGAFLSFFVLLLVHRLLAELLLKKFPRNVAVVGGDKKSLKALEFLQENPEFGLRVGYHIEPSILKFLMTGRSVKYNDINELYEILKEDLPDMMIVPSLGQRKAYPAEIFIRASLEGVEVKEEKSFLEQVRGYVDLNEIEGDRFVFTGGLQAGDIFARMVKRLFDVLLATTLLLLTLPIMLLAGICVKLSSKGPVLYKQSRVGRADKLFDLYKFRSMSEDAEQAGAPKWAEKNDPRVTPVGRFLRRTRIDELPQLFNVLMGDMSMIGPRPERPYFVSQLEQTLPLYSVRHAVKPGMSGWAQIRYSYGASLEDAARKLEYDLYYVKNYSLFFDMLIMLQTASVVFFPKGVR